MFQRDVMDKRVFSLLIAVNGMLTSHCNNLSTHHYLTYHRVLTKPGPDHIGSDWQNQDRIGSDRIGLTKPGPDRIGSDWQNQDRIGSDRIGLTKPGPDRIGSDWQNQDRIRSNRTDKTRTGSDRIGLTKPGPDRIGSDWQNQDRIGSDRTDKTRTGSDRTDKTRTGSDRINKTWIGLRPIDKTRTGSEKNRIAIKFLPKWSRDTSIKRWRRKKNDMYIRALIRSGARAFSCPSRCQKLDKIFFPHLLRLRYCKSFRQRYKATNIMFVSSTKWNFILGK